MSVQLISNGRTETEASRKAGRTRASVRWLDSEDAPTGWQPFKGSNLMGRTSDSRERLLEVAFELIWDNSYGSVSIDQMCERAKVNKGSFYYYFKTKSDLAVAAYDEHWKAKQHELDRMFSAQVAPLDRLSKWCGYIYEFQRQKAEKYGHVCGCPYGSIGTEVATQDDRIRTKTEEIMAKNAKYLESAIAEAKQEGLVTVEDPKAAAQRVYAFALGSLMQAKIQNDLGVLKSLEPTVMSIIGARTAVTA